LERAKSLEPAKKSEWDQRQQCDVVVLALKIHSIPCETRGKSSEDGEKSEMKFDGTALPFDTP
jgi:hypothetical protein